MSAHPSRGARPTRGPTEGANGKVLGPARCRHTPREKRVPQGAPPNALVAEFEWRPQAISARPSRTAAP
eukprot:1464874-Pyramimonas_sp.AAC.1